MTYEDAIAALADTRRRAIFESLRAHPRTVADIAETQPVSRPAVSQHLKVLQMAGLVDVRSEGTRRYYGIRRAGLDGLRQWIESFWDDVLDNFAAEIRRRNAIANPGDEHGPAGTKGH